MTGPLMIEKLCDEELITAEKFSFYFQHPSEDSWMDLGEPHMDLKREGTEFV